MSTTPHNRKYEFVAYSKAKRASTTVRKHVMRDYFERQDTLEQSASKTTTPAGKRRKARARAAMKDSSRDDWLNQQPTFEVSRVEESESTATPDTLPGSPRRCLTKLQDFQSQHKSPVGQSPGPYRVEPFNILSVKDIPNDLIYWHFALHTCYQRTSPWVHSTCLDWIQRVWRNAIADESLLYVLLSQAERSRVAVTHSADWTRYLYYKGRALSALRARIAAEKDYASDTLILLVSSQISHSITEGDMKAADLHMDAALELAARRKKELKGMALWHFSKMDAKHATIRLKRPSLVLDDTYLTISPPPELREVIDTKSSISRRTLPRDFPSSVDVMSGLHSMALAFKAPTSSSPAENYFLISHAQTLHRLSILAADACDGISTPSNAQSLSHASVALILCLELFGWEHCPMRFPWIGRSTFLKKLSCLLLPKVQLVLALEDKSFQEKWKESDATTVSLLWTLFISTIMSCVASPENPINALLCSIPFLEAMKIVVREMAISDMTGFEQALKKLPWSDEFCGMWSSLIGAQLNLEGAGPASEWPPPTLNSCCHGECEQHGVGFQLKPLKASTEGLRYDGDSHGAGQKPAPLPLRDSGRGRPG